MDKDLYGILTLDSRVRGNDKNDKSRGYDSHPRESEVTIVIPAKAGIQNLKNAYPLLTLF
jgi:hypothetical protein